MLNPPPTVAFLLVFMAWALVLAAFVKLKARRRATTPAAGVDRGPRALLVDSSIGAVNIRRVLADTGFLVEAVESIDAARGVLTGGHGADLVLCDVDLPGLESAEVAQLLKRVACVLVFSPTSNRRVVDFASRFAATRIDLDNEPEFRKRLTETLNGLRPPGKLGETPPAKPAAIGGAR